jgi:hypothetical protein
LAAEPIAELPAGLAPVAENPAPTVKEWLHAREYAAPR